MNRPIDGFFEQTGSPKTISGGGAISHKLNNIFILDSSVYILPDVNLLPDGYRIFISWPDGAVPTLNRSGSSTLLRRNGVTDTNLVCNVELAICLYLNKAANIWEIR